MTPNSDRVPADHATIISEVDAKQGRRGTQVLTVLIVSLALLGIAFIALMAWNYLSGPWPLHT